MGRESFEEALNRLKNSGTKTGRASYTPGSIKYTPVNPVLDLSIFNEPVIVPGSGVKTKENSKKKSSGINIWDMLSGTLGQPGGAVTDHAHSAIGGLKGFFDGNDDEPFWKEVLTLGKTLNPATTLAKGVVNGGKKQWDNWFGEGQGDLTWGDIPGVGFLNGMDKGWKRGQDIMEDYTSVENRWGKVGGGLGIDIALDPLTYLTGGASAASKLGKAKELEKISELSKGLGLTKKYKNSSEFLNDAGSKIAEDIITRMPNLPKNVVDKTVSNRLSKMTDDLNTARNKTYNENINTWGFSVPGTNKVGKVGTYGEKNLLHRSEALVLQSTVDDLLKKASKGNATHAKQLENLAKSRYNVGSMAELSKTQFDDLHEVLQPFMGSKIKGLPDADVVQQVVRNTLPIEKFTKLMDDFKAQNVPWKDVQKQFDEIIDQVSTLKPQYRASYGGMLSNMVKDYWQNAPVKNFNKVANERKAESMEWANRILKESDGYDTVETTIKSMHKNGNPNKLKPLQDKEFYKNVANVADSEYNKMGNFKTRFEHKLDKVNPFDARTLATGDKLVNSMGDHIADAHSQRIGETAGYGKDMREIEKYIDNYKGDKKKLMEQAIYTLEKHTPDNLHTWKDVPLPNGKTKRVIDQKWTPSKEVEDLANLMRPVIDRFGKSEQSAGVLDNLRSNYFPHVVKHDDDKMDEIRKFMDEDTTGLKGQSSSSKFSKSRKTFQTLAQRDNYIEKLEKAIQKATDPDTIESLTKQQERVADMFDTDVVSALQRRIKDGVRAKAMKDMQGKLSKYGMFKTIGNGDKRPTGLKELEPEEAKKLGLGKGRHFIHEDVLKGMKRVDEVFTAQGMNKFARHISAISDIWRPLVTYYKPSHYINNIIGNAINNMAAGVTVRDYGAARKLIEGYRKGSLSKSQMKIMEQAYKHNVVSGGFLHDAHQSFEFTDPTKLEKVAKAVGDNKAIRKVKEKAGESADDIARLANFINGMNKYGNVEQAAKQVRTYLFNYNELTNADRAMRVAVPFWNWTKRNVPLQMKLLMENPKFAMNVERFKELFNEGQEGQDWQKENGIKIPGLDYYTSVPSPTHDLDMLVNPRSLLSSTAPAGKVPLELMMNEKIFTGQPISYGSDNVQPEDLLPYLLSNMGIGNNAYEAASGEKGIIESLINLIKPVSEIRE